MAQKFNPEYSKMLNTPAPPADGQCKSAHTVVFHLPAELLGEVFLYIVESGLRNGDTRFAIGTFEFLRVCRRWNEVAIGFPQLWARWVPGAVKAWPLFNSRSKDGPLFLTWRPQHLLSARDILMDPAIPKRIRQLDLTGTSDQLVHFFGVLSSSPPSNASSIRLHVFPYDSHEPRGHFAQFLSSSFPKLSQLDLGNFLPNSSSPIFTTSSLTSLKLSLPARKKISYTLSQFAQIIKQHPNLRELNLSRGGIPLPGPSSPSIPIVLPRLANLRLYGMDAAILGLIDLIGMSSPLHDVVIRFGHNPDLTVPALTGTMMKILVAYYDSQGLDRPRKINRLTTSYNSEKDYLVFDARSHPAPTSNLKSNLRLQFDGAGALSGDEIVEETFPLFPLEDVREFSAEGLAICQVGYHGIFQRMRDLSHLRLDRLDIRPVLCALSSGNRGEPHRGSIPKLESLTLSHLDIRFGREEQLLDVLKGRRDHNVGLKKLVVRSCRVHKVEYNPKLGEVVKNVKWDNMQVVVDG